MKVIKYKRYRKHNNFKCKKKILGQCKDRDYKIGL